MFDNLALNKNEHGLVEFGGNYKMTNQKLSECGSHVSLALIT